MRFDGQMADPGHKTPTCPKCYSRRTLFDGRMGHYCMFCGHKFNIEEVQALPEHEFRQTHAALRTDLLVPSGRSGLFEFML